MRQIDERHFRELNAAVLEALRSLVRSLDAIKVQIDSIREQGDPSPKKEEPKEPQTVRTIPQLPPAITEYYETGKHPKALPNWRERIKLALEVVTLAALVWYACTTYRQWRTMDATFGEIRKQSISAEIAAGAAKSAANTASDQAKLLRIQLQATIGGILHIDPLSFSPPFRTSANWFYVSFTNIGHITTTDIRANMLISIHSVPENKVLSKIQTVSDPIPHIAPTDPARQGGPVGRFQWRGVYLLTAREAEMLNIGQAALIGDLSVSYNDGFEATKDGDCWAYLEGRNPFRCGMLPGEIAHHIETQGGNRK